MSETDLILKNNYDVEFLLIETSHPGNIGACARAIKNMGFGKLGLVNPSNFPSDEAFYRAKGAGDILDDVKIYSNLDDALAEKTIVLAQVSEIGLFLGLQFLQMKLSKKI